MGAGRPKSFGTVKELEEKVKAYFHSCDNRKKEVVTKGAVCTITKPKPYTVEGLASFLEVDRKTLLNYEKEEGYEEYFLTIKKAKAKILANLMERGLEGENVAPTTIFNLKNNYDYKDKTETDLTTNGDAIQSISPIMWIDGDSKA